MKPPQPRAYRGSSLWRVVSTAMLLLLLLLPARGQDGDTSLAGIVEDLSGARIAHANITLTNSDNGFHAGAVTDGGGRFVFSMFAPGRYSITASAAGMADCTQSGLELHVGGSMQLQLRMRPAGRAENITLVAPPPVIDPDSGEVSQMIDERAIADLPLNGRRYADLAPLSPGVTQDPRGLTSGSMATCHTAEPAATRIATSSTGPATTIVSLRRREVDTARRTSSATK